MYKRFKDRTDGGRVLAEKLLDFKGRRDVVLLALPRGGVPVGYEVAKALNLPLDIFLVRKLGVPSREELAFGAIASGGVVVLNESVIDTFKIPESVIKNAIAKEAAELKRREDTYRSEKPATKVRNKIVILVDDGIATGATLRAALGAIRDLEPKQIVVAAPVASRDVCAGMREKTNDLCICVINPEPFYGVGVWYRDFRQTSDEEVCYLLKNMSNNRAEVARSGG